MVVVVVAGSLRCSNCKNAPVHTRTHTRFNGIDTFLRNEPVRSVRSVRADITRAREQLASSTAQRGWNYCACDLIVLMICEQH